jgi:hypothetical protein
MSMRIYDVLWGTNDTVRKNLGGPRGDLTMIRCCLLSLSAVAMNTIHLWTTVEYESNAPYSDARIINNDALRYNPPGLHAIIELLKKPNTATYVRKPLAPGTERINILLTNLRNTVHDPSSTSFEDTVVLWYFELLLHGKYAQTQLV